ncbi:MAG: protein kinase [Labilithrix sp.]|nr:protein kinase [Labilithrix sp.]MCW5817366.1 protein kinase [Labilithrix sp.]
MAESLKRAVPPKAPRPAAGAPARVVVDEPPTTPAAPPSFRAHSRPPPGVSQSQSRPPTPLPAAGQTAATDIIAGKGAAPKENPSETTPPSSVHAVPTAGDRVGSYIVDKLIGSGGMGVVVAAKHAQTGDAVAIKLLRPKAAGDKIHAERFAREARAIAKITSDHVVKVLDAGTLDSAAPFIVMEYLVGRDLSQMIREDGPLRLRDAADVMLQVCDAVASAHAVGVIHRDLKPSNFFVTTRPDGRPHVKVLDFGIAKAIGTDGVVDPNLTETQAVFGSPTYMSPEQIRSAKHVDHRSDIWSLGVGLYEVTTGRLPFAADNVAGLLASIVADPPYYPRGFVPDMPPVFEELVLACLHKDAKQRVQTCGDLGLALAPFATPGPDTERLVRSITTLSPPTHQPFPGETGPRLPSPSNPLFGNHAQITGPPVGASSSPNVHSNPHLGMPSAPSWPGMQAAPEDQRTSGVVFGSTGSDLHALPKPIGKKVGTTIGILLAVLVVAIGVGGAVYYKKPAVFGAADTPAATSQDTPVAVAPAVTSAAIAEAPPAVTPPEVTPPPAPAPAPPPSVETSAKPSAATTSGKRGPRHPTGPASKPAGPASKPDKPVDPLNDRF